MKKVIIICLIILGFVGSIIYYFQGEEFKLYDEAVALMEQGEIYEAHDKIAKALEINRTNRQVISLKAKLFNLVRDDKYIKEAIKAKNDASKAIDKGDYALASVKIDYGILMADNVSSISETYPKAVALKNELKKELERISDEAPERYYHKALEIYNNGDDERAYELLTYIKVSNKKVIKLKDDIAYKLGKNIYNNVMKISNPSDVNIRDGIYWLKKVSESSPDNIEAKVMINNLKQTLDSKN